MSLLNVYMKDITFGYDQEQAPQSSYLSRPLLSLLRHSQNNLTRSIEATALPSDITITSSDNHTRVIMCWCYIYHFKCTAREMGPIRPCERLKRDDHVLDFHRQDRIDCSLHLNGEKCLKAAPPKEVDYEYDPSWRCLQDFGEWKKGR